jgi:hypothetical protein
MTDSFHDYETDFKSQISSIKKDIQTLNISLSPTSNSGKIFNRLDIVKRLAEQHKHLKATLAHMELESNEGTPEQRAQSKQRLTEFKTESSSLEREISRLKQEAVTAERVDLVNRAQKQQFNSTENTTTTVVNISTTDSQLHEMTKNTDTMNKNTDKLKEVLQLTDRMNKHADDTLAEQRRQDETTDRIIMTGQGTETEVNATQRMLRDMKSVSTKNNMLLAGIVIILILLIAGLLYYRS